MFLLRELVLRSHVIWPDDDALRRSVVCQDLGIEALREGEPKCHQPNYSYDDSGVSSRKPGLEGMDYSHIPARKMGDAFMVPLVNRTTNAAGVKTPQLIRWDLFVEPFGQVPGANTLLKRKTSSLKVGWIDPIWMDTAGARRKQAFILSAYGPSQVFLFDNFFKLLFKMLRTFGLKFGAVNSVSLEICTV